MGSTVDEFKVVNESEYPKIVELLKARLPISGQVYNMALVLNIFPKEMTCYTLGGDLSPNALILIIFDREDYGQDINMSLSKEFQVTPEIKQAFTSTKVIQWKGCHMFVLTDRRISHMIFEISTVVFRNSVTFNPNYGYWKEPENITETISEEDKNGVVLKALDEDKGLKFLTQSWRYVRPGTETYLKKIIKHHITAGVYQNGDLVSGAIVNGHGLIGMLSTNPEHRNKGHAMKCMRYLMQEMTKKGFAIVSSSQQENSYSLALHDKLKFIQTHECDYIFHIPYHK
ncbi:uncharacterized protein LOC110862716 [Folsomia candida]|uniref:uncharacterized protein LOC110862716 n=1 Tax=Folsomia candida TaxID=158441 RepID=UPI000B8F4011|nr:uncharacterized protein LOC110862716 [Folsomia candida]